MTASISLTGLAANDPVPGNYAEINFAAGPASGGTGDYAVLLLGNKTSGGSATVDSVIYGPDTTTPLANEADAIALFGNGSELHRMWKRFTKVNLSTSVYALAVTESVGAAATGTITLSTTATGGGTLRVYVCDEFVDVAIASGDTVTTIAAAAKAAINGKLDWPVTADNSAGVLALTAKQLGLRGNWLRYWSRIFPSCGTTTSTSSVAFMTGGSTADSSTTALATILPTRYYYIVSAAQDATQAGALLTQVNTQALPITGIRQRVFVGSVDTAANAITIATGLNGARAELAWLAQSDVPPCELAANHAAVASLEEAPLVPRCNFSGYGNDSKTTGNWKIKAPLSGAAPTRAQIKSALNNGVTAIGVNKNGTTYLVKRVTTRSLTSSQVDYRIRDAHKVTICDRYVDDLIAKANAAFSGKLVGDDPIANQPIQGPDVITPRVLKALINKLTRDYGDNDLLQRVAEIILGTIAVRESSPTTRLSASVPLQPIDILDQVAFQVNQVA